MSAARAAAQAWVNRAPLAVPADSEGRAQIYERLLHEAERHLRAVLAGEPPWAAPAPQPEPPPLTPEQKSALCEAAEYDASDAYFKPRQDLDSRTARRLFAAGFTRGWKARS